MDSPASEKPILVYDGDCTFCRLWIDRWRALTGDRVQYAPFQEVSTQFPEIPREALIVLSSLKAVLLAVLPVEVASMFLEKV